MKHPFSLLVPILLLLASCTAEDRDNAATQLVSTGPVTVEFCVDTQPEIVVKTRATEEEIHFAKEVHLLVFDGSMPGSKLTEQVAVNIEATGNQRAFKVTLTASEGKPRTIVVVTNADEFFKATSLMIGNSYETIEKALLCNLTVVDGVATPPSGSNIPMVGIQSVQQINSFTQIGTYEAPLRLQRTWAKLSVKLSTAAAALFTLTGISVADAPAEGVVLPSIATPTVLHTSTTRARYYTDADNLSASLSPTESHPIYLFESKNSVEEEGKHVSILMKGLYNGTIYYYHIDLAKPTADNMPTSSDRMNLLRNHHYQVSINKINVAGYSTAKEALSNKPSNIDYEVEITDETALGVVSNGQYALATTWSESEKIIAPARTSDANIEYPIGTVTIFGKELSADTNMEITMINEDGNIDLKQIHNTSGNKSVALSFKFRDPNIPTKAVISIRFGNLTKKININLLVSDKNYATP